MGTGTITFALNGKQCTAYVSNVVNKSAIDALANNLHSAGFSRAGITRVTYCEGVDLDIAGTSGDYDDVGLFANVLFRRQSDGKLYGLLIHAPTVSMFQAVSGQGYRVTQGDGIALADLYSDCAGEEFTFHDGWLQGSSLRGNLAP